ncbi:MAG: type II secretion system protein N [Pseudomonadota bacterium]
MTLRLVAFVIWAAVAASAMFWALRLGAASPVAPAHTVAAGAAAPMRGDLTRVFGAAPAREAGGANQVVETPLSSRFKLLGVAAPRQGGDRTGLALIAVDGKPARSYAVGAPVDGELLLQSVHARGARLGARGAAPQVTLELPALPLAATGSLPTAPAAVVGFPGAPQAPGAFVPPAAPLPVEAQANDVAQDAPPPRGNPNR